MSAKDEHERGRCIGLLCVLPRKLLETSTDLVNWISLSLHTFYGPMTRGLEQFRVGSRNDIRYVEAACGVELKQRQPACK